ncbi:hypothetical protein D3C79_734510 [compost metagenome]
MASTPMYSWEPVPNLPWITATDGSRLMEEQAPMARRPKPNFTASGMAIRMGSRLPISCRKSGTPTLRIILRLGMIMPAYWVPRISRLKPTILPQKPSSFSPKRRFQPGMRSLTGLAETIMPMMTAKSMGSMGMMAMPILISCFPMRYWATKISRAVARVLTNTVLRGVVCCIVCSLVMRCHSRAALAAARWGHDRKGRGALM